MKKVYEGTLVEMTDWISTSTEPPNFVGTFAHAEPIHNGGTINTVFSLPISDAFAPFPKTVRRIVVYIE